MLENLDIEQDYWSKTSESVNTVGHDSFRLMKYLASYENTNYYDLMGSVSNCLNEIS